MVQIVNGSTGALYKAKVDSTSKLDVRSVSEEGQVEALVNGDAYFVTSGEITLTNAAESAIIWYQNQDDFDLLLDSAIFSAGVSTGGTTNVCAIGITLNPTGLGSGSSTSVTALNLRIGATKQLDVTSSEIGAQGATVTGGTAAPSFYFPDKLTSVYDSSLLLTKGNGIALTVTPPASNTSLVVSVSLNLHRVINI